MGLTVDLMTEGADLNRARTTLGNRGLTNTLAVPAPAPRPYELLYDEAGISGFQLGGVRGEAALGGPPQPIHMATFMSGESPIQYPANSARMRPQPVVPAPSVHELLARQQPALALATERQAPQLPLQLHELDAPPDLWTPRYGQHVQYVDHGEDDLSRPYVPTARTVPSSVPPAGQQVANPQGLQRGTIPPPTWPPSQHPQHLQPLDAPQDQTGVYILLLAGSLAIAAAATGLFDRKPPAA